MDGGSAFALPPSIQKGWVGGNEATFAKPYYKSKAIVTIRQIKALFQSFSDEKRLA